MNNKINRYSYINTSIFLLKHFSFYLRKLLEKNKKNLKQNEKLAQYEKINN